MRNVNLKKIWRTLKEKEYHIKNTRLGTKVSIYLEKNGQSHPRVTDQRRRAMEGASEQTEKVGKLLFMHLCSLGLRWA